MKIMPAKSNIKFDSSRSLVMKVDKAIGLQKKKITVEKIKHQLEKSILAVNIRFQGVTVTELQDFRRSLPSDARFIIAKNSLIQIASNTTHGWSDLSSLASFESGILVVEEKVGEAIKAYENFESRLKKSGKENIFHARGGVLDGNLLTSRDILKLKTLPTKEETMSQIAMTLKGAPLMFALAMKSAPGKLARVISEISKKESLAE